MRFLRAGGCTKTSTISNSASKTAENVHLLRCDLRSFVRRRFYYASAVARSRLASETFSAVLVFHNNYEKNR